MTRKERSYLTKNTPGRVRQPSAWAGRVRKDSCNCQAGGPTGHTGRAGSAPVRTSPFAPSEMRHPKGLWWGLPGFRSSGTLCPLCGEQRGMQWGRDDTSQDAVTMARAAGGHGSTRVRAAGGPTLKAEPVGLPDRQEVEGTGTGGIEMTPGTLPCATETGESAQGKGGPRHSGPMRSEVRLLPSRFSLWPSLLPSRSPRSQQIHHVPPQPPAPRVSRLPARLTAHSQGVYSSLSRTASLPMATGTASHPRDCPPHSLH